MAEYIEREALLAAFALEDYPWTDVDEMYEIARKFPAADVVEVVRCQDCIHAEPFDRNCELNTSAYMHCKLYRGDLKKYVWHKYKKYYKEYSVVDRDGFCDEGERIENV